MFFMKKYNLSASFVKWEGTAETSTEQDSFDHVIEFESEDEAKVRLESLIIDKMSSKPGWRYKLVDSKISEFPLLQEQESTLIINEQTMLSEQPSISEEPQAPGIESQDENIPPDQVSA